MNDISVESTQIPASAPEQFASVMADGGDWKAALPESWADKLRDV